MRRTALILAGALAFDLGVVAVAALAQQQTREPPRRPAAGPGPTEGRAGGVSGVAVVDPGGPGGNGGCTGGPPIPERPGRPCPAEPAAISDQAAAGNLTSFLPVASSDGHKHRQDHVFIKLDRVNTVRACIARRGEVVEHEGARQCRLPQAAGDPIGNPIRIPPRN